MSGCLGLSADGGRFESPFDVVAIAASVGGLMAMKAVLTRLPAEFPCAVVMIQHRSPQQELSGVFVDLLRRRCTLPVREAADGDELLPGTIFVAPSRRYLMADESRRIVLTDSKGTPHSASSADVTLKSLAKAFGNRSIAVILTGANRDGAAGVISIKAVGGRVLIQDAESAQSFGMPGAALCTGCIDFVLPLDKIAPAVIALTMQNGAAELFRVPIPHWAQLQ